MNTTIFNGKRPVIGQRFVTRGDTYVVGAIAPGAIVGRKLEYLNDEVPRASDICIIREEFKDEPR